MAEEVVEIELASPAGSGAWHELDRTIRIVTDHEKNVTREKKRKRQEEIAAATARRALKWSLGIATASLTGIGLTLFVTGILPV